MTATDDAILPFESPARVAPGVPERRLPTLDGVRGLAILMVMIFHMSVIGFTDRPNRAWVDVAWLRVAMFGWAGVDLFFVLSGFLITGILLDAKGAREPGSSGYLGRRLGGGYFSSFYARRVLRVFPLYYGVVVFALVVLPHIPNVKSDRFGSIHGDEIWYWTLLSNWSIGLRHAFRHGILDVSWSLAIEEQFYLLWPAVVLLAGRRTLAWICGGLVAASIATRAVLVVRGASYVTVLALTPCRMDALACGALLALVARRPGGLVAARRALRWIGGVVGAGLLAILVVRGPDWTFMPVLQVVGFTVIAVSFAAGVGLAASGSGRVFRAWPMRKLGQLSYALYLFHSPLRGVIRDRFYGANRFLTIGSSQLPGQFLFYAMALAVSLAAAWASWHVIEQPVLRLKRFFPMPTQAAGAGQD